jgi:hypothetical protein
MKWIILGFVGGIGWIERKAISKTVIVNGVAISRVTHKIIQRIKGRL